MRVRFAPGAQRNKSLRDLNAVETFKFEEFITFHNVRNRYCDFNVVDTLKLQGNFLRATMKTVSEHSAGGVVYRQKEEGRRKKEEGVVEWLICKHSGYHKWVLPKGIVEEAERPEETAVREVLEETGVKAEVVSKISPEVRYKYMKQGTPLRQGYAGQALINKRVEFYLMKYAAGDIQDHCWEMEDVKWATGEEALKLLAFETERKILKIAIGQL